MNNIFEKELKEGEKIIWEGSSQTNVSPILMWVTLIIFIILAGSLAFSIGGETEIWKLMTIPLGIAALGIFIISHMVRKYAFTDYRILTKKYLTNSIRSHYYHKIHQIIKKNDSVGNANFHLITDLNYYENNSGQELSTFPILFSVPNSIEVFSILTKLWYEKSPKKRVANNLEKWAKENDLEFSSYHPSKQMYCSVKGQYMGLPFSLQLGSILHLKDFKITFQLPNPYSFHLQIQPETFLEKLRKWTGMQDLKVGDTDFDKDYILQSNDLTFLKDVLTPDVRETYQRNTLRIPGILQIGNPEKESPKQKKPRRPKGFDDVLDAHLTESKVPDRVYKDGNNSPLTYQATYLSNLPQYPDLLMEHIEKTIEAVTAIATRIEHLAE